MSITTGEGSRRQEKEYCDEESDKEPSPRGVLETPLPFTGSYDGSNNGSHRNSNNFGGSSASLPQEKAIKHHNLKGIFETAGGRFADSQGVLLRDMVDQVMKKSTRKLTTIPFLGGIEFSKRQLRKKLGRNKSAEENIDSEEYLSPKPSWRKYTLKELVDATANFSDDKLVGEGGHAKVYKGRLPSGQIVAVKKITKTQKNDDVRVNDFLQELGIIAHINHPNATRLVGFASDGDLHLIFHFAKHGSLANVLHGEGKPLDWQTRYKVATGVADGLHYLHCECNRRIVHRDITSSNILLNDHYEAQISDFGLAKWLPEKCSHHVVSPIEGTFGYMAPEYFMHGVVHEKTDVFAFGVLLLELITGQRAVNSNNQSLAVWAKPYLEKKNVKELADPRLADIYDEEEMNRAMCAASLCIHHLPNMRPNMIKVVKFLKGEYEQDMGPKSLCMESCDLEDYTSTSYLNNMNRHMQLISE